MDALPTLPLGIDGWCLRAWRTADAPSLARHANDERVWRNMSEGFPHPYTLEIARHWVERGHVDFGGTNWAIAFDDEAVGGCGIHPGEGRERCNCEIGYWLGESFWGCGVVTDVVRVLTAQALAHPGITRAFAAVHADNPASMRVLEKNSFHREGLLRQSAIKAGRPIDRVLWARLRAAPEPCVMSGMRAGAIGAVVSLHAAYYGRYHDLGSVFEARVAQAMGEFVVRLDPARDGLWLLVDGERILGSIAIDAGSTAARACGGAQLRWFIVDPSLHRRGFGRRLLAAALDHCRAAALRLVWLDTFAGLDAARTLYERAGFRCVHEAEAQTWGRSVREQRFEWTPARWPCSA